MKTRMKKKGKKRKLEQEEPAEKLDEVQALLETTRRTLREKTPEERDKIMQSYPELAGMVRTLLENGIKNAKLERRWNLNAALTQALQIL